MKLHTQEVYDRGLIIIKDYIQQKNKEEQISLLKSFLDKPASFQEHYARHDQFRFNIERNEFFAIIDIDMLIKEIKKMSNQDLLFLRNVLQNRFIDQKMVTDELQQIKTLNKKLIEYKKDLVQKNKKLKVVALDFLLDTINKAIVKSSSVQS